MLEQLEVASSAGMFEEGVYCCCKMLSVVKRADLPLSKLTLFENKSILDLHLTEAVKI